MARNIAMSPGAKVYRAVAEITFQNGSQQRKCEGPYSSPAAARARVTFWTGYLSNHTVIGRVEEGTVSWSVMEEN